MTNLVRDPEHDLIALSLELNESQRLLQLEALLRQLAEQQLPQTVQLIEALLLRGETL